MPQVDLLDIYEVLSAFTGARQSGEKFAITNMSLQIFVESAARWLAKNPNDVRPLIDQAVEMRIAALEEGIGISGPGIHPMKLITEKIGGSVTTKLCDCRSYPPFP
jgi:hypothetical protein